MVKPRRAPLVRSMRVQDFLAQVHQGVAARLGAEYGGFDSRQRFSYLQYFRGSPDVHYEVWAQRRTGRLEIGLHFEGERDANYAAIEALALRAGDIQAALGPEYEIEEWTKQWTRLHRTFEAQALTSELADDAAERAVALMRALEPILDEMDLR